MLYPFNSVPNNSHVQDSGEHMVSPLENECLEPHQGVRDTFQKSLLIICMLIDFFFHMSSQLKQNAYQLGSSRQVGVKTKILETNIWIMVTCNLPDGQTSECSGCIGD